MKSAPKAIKKTWKVSSSRLEPEKRVQTPLKGKMCRLFGYILVLFGSILVLKRAGEATRKQTKIQSTFEGHF